MRLTGIEFLKTKLNTAIPALADIARTASLGQDADAERAFAAYVRGTLQPEKYFRIPYYPPENAWLARNESEEAVAARLAEGKIMSVGFLWDFGPGGIRWEANPTPNHYREWTWQLNRHHEWRMLGHLYRETGDETYARLFVELFTSWREQTECPDDVSGFETEAWRTIEIGIRMTKIWHYAIHAFYRSPSVTDHTLTEIFASMWENANRLRCHPTHGNWLIMEMSGLYHVGLLYPFFAEADAWREYATSRMTDELDVQLYPDSFQYELTTNYHGVVVNNYTYAIDTSRAMDAPLPTPFLAVLERAYELYPRLAMPDFTLPDLNDGCRADAAGMCAEALKLFPAREDYRYLASRRAEGTPPPFTDYVFPYSGMAVLRDSWDADSQWAFFESAPFGRGHQHDDKLNFLLYAYGRNLLRDTGNYAYDSSMMRRYVLSSFSHNTALVDGLGQNRHARYAWHDEDIHKLSDLTASLGRDSDVLGGVYNEGYGRELLDVTHRRTVVRVKCAPLGLKTFYLIIDRFTPADGGEHTYDVNWQLEAVPFTAETNGGTRVTADYGDGVSLSILSPAALVLRCGCRAPFMGWRTNGPAPSVVLRARGRETRVVTLLYPSDAGCPVTSVEASCDPAARTVTVRTADGAWTYAEP